MTGGYSGISLDGSDGVKLTERGLWFSRSCSLNEVS